MFYILRFIVLILLFLCLTGCETSALPLRGLKVKIGIITPNTGTSSVLGRQGVSGIKIAKQLQSYLDYGDEIKLIIIDDVSEPEKSLAALDTLVNKHKLSAILLLSASDSAIAIAKNATNPKTTQYSKFVNQLAFDDTTQAIVAALYVRDELFIKKVAIFTNSSSTYSHYLAQECAKKFNMPLKNTQH